MSRIFTVVALGAWMLALPALAQDLPQFPKIAPPSSLPEAACDTGVANSGDWLLGRWVSPQSRWEFKRQDGALVWSLDRKGSINTGFGWSDGTRLDGVVRAISACSFTLSAGNDQFVMDGVLTEDGKIYGAAANPKGDTARFLLRRER